MPSCLRVEQVPNSAYLAAHDIGALTYFADACVDRIRIERLQDVLAVITDAMRLVSLGGSQMLNI